jgi:pSer/pThr/pTyr-binding forkhead associated (FHA) protein
MKAVVSYINSPTKDVFETSGNKIIFGRSPNANISIKREEMSRYHFQIEIENGDCFITDLNSSNGVYINGEKIPSDQKIPYSLIFPIEIAQHISITLYLKEEDENHTPLNSPVITKNSSSYSEKKNKEPLTKTKTLQVPELQLSSAPQKKLFKKALNPKEAQKNKKQSSPQLILLILVVLAIPIYIHFSGEEMQVSDQESVDSELPDPVTTQATVDLPKLEPESFSYEDLIQKTSCNSLGSLCSIIGLSHEKEGITFHDNKALLFVNLEHVPSEEVHQEFKNLPEKAKAEYYMAQAATHDQLMKELLKRNPTHLIVVGFNLIDSQARFKYLLNISYKQIPLLDQGIHEFLFAEIFYSGRFKLYKAYVGHYTEFSEL